MPAIQPRAKTVYFWHVNRSNKISMLYRYNEAKKAKTAYQQIQITSSMTTSEVQRRIIHAIKKNTVDAHDFSNGITLPLTTIYSYLPLISKDVIKEALTEWDIKVLNEGIFIPGIYF